MGFGFEGLPLRFGDAERAVLGRAGAEAVRGVVTSRVLCGVREWLVPAATDTSCGFNGCDIGKRGDAERRVLA